MTDVDKQLFPADSRDFNWNIFLYPYFAGLRVYMLSDPLTTWKKSYNRYKLLKFIHFTLLGLFYTLLLLLIYYILYRKIFYNFNAIDM